MRLQNSERVYEQKERKKVYTLNQPNHNYERLTSDELFLINFPFLQLLWKTIRNEISRIRYVELSSRNFGNYLGIMGLELLRKCHFFAKGFVTAILMLRNGFRGW
jgi:hypothetical protein